MQTADPIENLISGIKQQSHAALAKAMSLVESARPDHRIQAQTLLAGFHPSLGRSFKIGMAGAPGVGKSSFASHLAARILAQGKRVAILPVDPSSPVHGGSLLGDLTRMGAVFDNERLFFRALPSRGESALSPFLGDYLTLCDGFGFDYVLIETVGIGQADFLIKSFVDFLILLEQPGSGDEIQAMKSGLIELADCLLVSKADGDLKSSAEQSLSYLKGRLREQSELRLESYSVFDPESFGLLLENVLRDCELKSRRPDFKNDRSKKAKQLLEIYLMDHAWSFLSSLSFFKKEISSLERQVEEGVLAPSYAGRRLFSELEKKLGEFK